MSADSGENGIRINPVVFYGSAAGIVIFALWTIVLTESAREFISAVLGWISGTFGWLYFLSVIAY